MTRMVKSFSMSNKHYKGLSERWTVEVTYIGGGARSHFEGTMAECQQYIERTLVKTGQPYSDDTQDETSCQCRGPGLGCLRNK
jgi:hypothetical protein